MHFWSDAIAVLEPFLPIWKGLSTASEELLSQGKEVSAGWVLGGRESPGDAEVIERKKINFKDTERDSVVLFETRKQQKAAGQKGNPLQVHPIQGRNIFINLVYWIFSFKMSRL